jgi:hypothetical protein
MDDKNIACELLLECVLGTTELDESDWEKLPLVFFAMGKLNTREICVVTNVYIKGMTFKATAAITPRADGSGVGLSASRAGEMAKGSVYKLKWILRRSLTTQLSKVMTGEIEPKDFYIPPVEEVEKPRHIPAEVKDLPVERLELSMRSSNCLLRANINTVGELASKSMPEMIAIRNLGRRSLNELKHTLNEMGLSFRP